MPFVVGNGLRFHVQLLGADGSAPIAMLHGLLVGSLTSWYFGAGPRLARRHRVLLYDLRGHGRSQSAPSGYDTATMGADLEALLDALGPAPVTLVGHSYGALVALRFALARPWRVARLALVETPLPPARAGELAGFVRLPPAEMALALPAPLRAQVEHGGRAARVLVERLAALASDTTLLADLARESDPSDEELASIDCPALLVSGASSGLAAASERLARALPRARHVVLEGGHFLPAEAPAALAAELEAFCDG